jgi:predicted transcriptional regulator YheO
MNNLLDTLKRMANGVAKTFGEDCEVVIYDVENEIEDSIIYILNGHVSKRDVKGGSSYLVLNVRSHLDKLHEDKLGYIIKSNNRYLKCSTMYFYEVERLKYIFSINFDITELIKTQEAIGKIVMHSEEEELDQFPNDVNTMLKRLIEQSVDIVGKPVEEMTYKEKAEAIKFLNECGAFLITKATDVVAEYFGISKYTIYNHIK